MKHPGGDWGVAGDPGLPLPAPARGRTTRILPTRTLINARPAPWARTGRRAGPLPGNPLLRALLLLALLAGVLGGIAGLAWVDRWANLGVTWDAAQTPIAGTGLPPLGVNVFLEKEADTASVDRTLDLVRDGGFTWIRQGFPWNDIEIAGKGNFFDRRSTPPRSAWAKYDYIVEQARARNLEILARLDAPPDWARKYPVAHSPPAHNADFADFVRAVVSRYRGKIRYFQIWNEPNLEGEWAGHPDPIAYTALLKEAYLAAHAANPDVVVLMAPLAPTKERGPANLNDLLYLQGMYDAGAGAYFDLGNAVIYGLANSPADRRTDLDRINFSRPVLTRDVMVRNGDSAKGLWASEYGWVSLPAGWDADPANKPSIWGNQTPEEQAAYLVDGYRRARAEWPWMGPLFVWHLRDPTPLPHEPQPYFGILNLDFSPRPAYLALQAYSRRFPVADTGAGTPASPAFTTAGPWQQDAPGGRPVYTAMTPDSSGTLTFQGNSVDLIFAPGAAPARVLLTLDGAPPPGLPAGPGGTGAITIPAGGAGDDRVVPDPAWPAPPGMRAVRLPVAGGLAETAHTLTLRPGAVDTPLALLGFVVARRQGQAALYAGGYALLTLLAVWLGVRSTFALTAVPAAVRQALAQPGRAGERARAALLVAGLVVALTAFYSIPSQRVALVALGVWFVLAVLRPDLALVITAATIPLSWAPRPLFTWSFPPGELALWSILLATGLRRAWAAWTARRAGPTGGQAGAGDVTGYLQLYQALQGPAPWRERVRVALRRDLFGGPALALLAVATFSLLTVANPGYVKDSLHAYRWVIVEPLLFYFLATDLLRGGRGALRLADGFVAGGVLAAAGALLLPALHVPGSTLDVQGVVAFQGFFPSHDNLGLYLGRSLAFTAGLVLFLNLPAERLRRRLYAAAALVMAPALLLSYSRGAWLAVAVAGVLLLWMLGARAARVGAAVFAVAGIALLIAAEAHLLPERIVHTGSGLIRLDLWRSALAMIRDHPVFGIGLDQFLNQYQGQYLDFTHPLERWLSHPHNLLLDCWLSLGIIGVLVAGWLVARVVRGGRALARTGDARTRALACAVLAGMTAVVVHGSIDNSYFLQDLALTFWLFCALLQILWKQAPEPPGPAGGGRR